MADFIILLIKRSDNMLYRKKHPPEYKKAPSYTMFWLFILGVPIILTIILTLGEVPFFATLIICVPLVFIFRQIAFHILPCCTVQEQNSKIFREFHQFTGRVYVGRRGPKCFIFPDVDLAFWVCNDELHISSNLQTDDFGEIVIPFENIDYFSKDNTYKITLLNLKDGKEKRELSFDYNTYTAFNALIPQFERSRVLSRSNSKSPSNTVIFNFEAEKKEKGAKCPYCGTYIPYEKTICPECGAANPAFDRINDDEIERLKKLKQLLDSGAITQEEYDRMKKQIIN